MSSLIEVEYSTLATLVENYMTKAKERYISGLNEDVAQQIEFLKQYQSSFWMKVLLKKPSPMKDLEAEARKSQSYHHLVYYARRMAFVEKFRSIVTSQSTIEKILLSVDDHQRLIDCDVIYDYDITGNYGRFMRKKDWM